MKCVKITKESYNTIPRGEKIGKTVAQRMRDKLLKLKETTPVRPVADIPVYIPGDIHTKYLRLSKETNTRLIDLIERAMQL